MSELLRNTGRAVNVGGVGVGRLSVGTTLSGEGPLGQAQSEVANVTVQDLEGRTVKLSELTNGKVSVVYFWGADCAPCEKQAPRLSELYGELKRSDFTVVAVNAHHDSKKAIEKFVKTHGFGASFLGYPGTAANDFGVKVVPTTILLDKEGVLVDKYVGYTEEKETALRTRIESLVR